MASLPDVGGKDNKNSKDSKHAIRLSPEMISKFALGKKIGKGAHGIVAHATRRSDGQVGVLKSIAKRDPFETEVKVYTAVKPHAGIAQLYESFAGEPNYLFLEYITGTNMKDESYTVDYVAYYIRQICLILQHLHSSGFVYVDIKSENFIESNDQIKLIDFGLAEPIGSPMGRIGTIYFMPPEMVDRIGTFQPTVDIWALGVLTYYLVFDVYPFDVDDDDSNVSNNNTNSKSSGFEAISESKNSNQSNSRSNSQSDSSNSRSECQELSDEEYDEEDDIILAKIKAGIYSFPEEDNAPLMDFIKKLLQVDPEKRMSLSYALQHPFLTAVLDATLNTME